MATGFEILFLALVYTMCNGDSDNGLPNNETYGMITESGNAWQDIINNSNLINGNKLSLKYSNNTESECDITIKTSLHAPDYYGKYYEDDKIIEISAFTTVNTKILKTSQNAKSIILKHEIGHWFGLQHLIMHDNKTGYSLIKTQSIMYPYLHLNDTNGIKITEYDAEKAIRKLFKNANSLHAEWTRT